MFGKAEKEVIAAEKMKHLLDNHLQQRSSEKSFTGLFRGSDGMLTFSVAPPAASDGSLRQQIRALWGLNYDTDDQKSGSDTLSP